MTDYQIPRDEYKRPLLYTPEGGKRVAYSRPSTLAKDLDDGKNLIPYSQAQALLGAARDPAIINRVKAIVAKGGNWDSNKGDLKEIVKTAELLGGSESKANRGTALHDFTDALEDGNLDWSLVPEELKGPLDGYQEYILDKGIKILAKEVFLQANIPVKLSIGNAYTLRCAGSADRIIEIDGKRYMDDIKTGKDKDFRQGVSAQLALYVEGKLYQDAGVRQDIPWAEWFPNADGLAEYADHDCDYNLGVMSWCPQAPNAQGKWEWELLWVPLERGRQIVRAGQLKRKLKWVPEFKRVEI